MLELLEQAPPRSESTVQRLTEVATRRTKRMANQIGGAFIALTVIVFLFVVATERHLTHDAVVTGVGLVLLMGFLPAFAIRRILMRDVRALVRVAREGRVYQPIAGGDRLDLFGGMSSLSLIWKEDGKDALAQFDVFKPDLKPVLATDVRVLARPRDKFVLAVLGDNGVFVGLRRRYFGKIVKD